jgi:hypothetical protein
VPRALDAFVLREKELDTAIWPPGTSQSSQRDVRDELLNAAAGRTVLHPKVLEDWPQELPAALRGPTKRLARILGPVAKLGRATSRQRRAIEAAARAMWGAPGYVWISPMLERLSADYVLRTQAEQNGHERRADPAAILAGVKRDLSPDDLAAPRWVTSRLVAWLAHRFSLGRGGGRNRKLSPHQVQRLLRNPATLAKEIERDAGRLVKSDRSAARELRRLAARIRNSAG